jgi:hypothetical protein
MPATSNISGFVISILLGVGIALPQSRGISEQAAGKAFYEILSPNGLAIDARGALYISDIEAHHVLRIDRSGRRRGCMS